MFDLATIKRINGGGTPEERAVSQVLRALEAALAERGCEIPLGYTVAQAAQEITRAIRLAGSK